MKSLNNRDADIKHIKCVLQDDGSYLDKHGYTRWYNEEGYFHNDNGPMTTNAKGTSRVWALDGKLLAFEQWLDIVNKTDEEKMLLKLQYT